jgi:hypothetical protein
LIIDRLHAGLASYVERQQLEAPTNRIDGAVVLSFDGRYRIYCRPAPHGDLVLESKLADVPDKPSDAEDLIRTTLMASAVRMMTHADVPVLSKNGLVILLHQRLPADATVDELEGSLLNFVKSLSEWRRIFRIL